MAATALIISLVAAALAGVAYWRSGGERDVQRAHAHLRNDLDAVRAKQRELLDHASQALASAYAATRAELKTVNGKLTELSSSAVDGVQAQVRRAADHTRQLIDAVDRSADHARHLAVDAARHAEQTVSRRVRRVHARVVLLEVKAKATLASRAAADRDFERADRRLAEATELLADARTIMADDEVISAQLTTMKTTLRDAADAVRARAEDTRQRIDHVVADTDRVVGDLEAAEDHAEGSAQPVG